MVATVIDSAVVAGASVVTTATVAAATVVTGTTVTAAAVVTEATVTAATVAGAIVVAAVVVATVTGAAVVTAAGLALVRTTAAAVGARATPGVTGSSLGSEAPTHVSMAGKQCVLMQVRHSGAAELSAHWMAQLAPPHAAASPKHVKQGREMPAHRPAKHVVVASAIPKL